MTEIKPSFYCHENPNEITCTEIIVNSIPILILDNVLSSTQCDMIIELYNNNNPEHVSNDGYDIGYRDNFRVLHRDKFFAEYIYSRVSSFLDQNITISDNFTHRGIEDCILYQGEWQITSINELFRICKYEDGGKFEKHYDGFYKVDKNNRSFKTLMLYLNDNDAGTSFFGDNNTTVIPKTGSCVIFNHYILHKGDTVVGEKYIMRSDIMYTKIEDNIINKDTSIKYKAAIQAELGRLAEEEGNMDLAVKYYMEAMKIDPSFDLK